MLVTGIDQSFRSTALVTTKEDGTIYSVKLIKTSKSKDPNQAIEKIHRAINIRDSILETLESINPNKIMIEGLSFNSSTNATRDLGGLFYLIVSSILESPNLPIPVIVPPLTLKAFACHGRASKEEMMERVPDHALEALYETGAKKTTGIYDLVDAYFLSRLGVAGEFQET